MVLRESISANGEYEGLEGLADESFDEVKGVPHSRAILKYVDAFMSNDTEALTEARELLVNEMGSNAMVDAAGIASNFQRYNRAADSTGIPSDTFTHAVTEELREEIGINDFVTAENTKEPSWITRLFMKYIVGSIVLRMLRNDKKKGFFE